MEALWDTLKTRQRQEREGWDSNAALRIHRALSWLHRAAREQNDPDARFLFLWIAFNAAYANELDQPQKFSERWMFREFIERLCRADKDGKLYELVWKKFSSSIRLLLDNQFVFQPFWDHLAGRLDEQSWLSQFDRSRQQAKEALARQDTATVLATVLDRLYTLRNQLVHGGATWNSQVNRQQIRDACAMMEALVPVTIELMMDTADESWGQACYPNIKP
jgi:hypothetical protein